MNIIKLQEAIDVLYKAAIKLEKKAVSMWGGQDLSYCAKCGEGPLPKSYFEEELCYNCKQNGAEKNKNYIDFTNEDANPRYYFKLIPVNDIYDVRLEGRLKATKTNIKNTELLKIEECTNLEVRVDDRTDDSGLGGAFIYKVDPDFIDKWGKFWRANLGYFVIVPQENINKKLITEFVNDLIKELKFLSPSAQSEP